MSSLPQGWHGIPVPARNSLSSVASITSAVPTTIRKKWNSSLSNEVPRSKLPAYKPPTVRLHKSPVNGILPTRNVSKTLGLDSKNDASIFINSSKQSPTKQYQNEIAKLKKELASLKNENSILKVKVRRVDDENAQKSRRIEKLTVELKTAQKVESSNSKKSKDTELLVLRQKCLRLECALKEKDLALKRLNNEALKLEGTSSRDNTTNFEEEEVEDEKQNKLNETFQISAKPGTAQTSLSRSSHSTKTEVAKLREIIHKLEKENQELQQQVKDKGEEVRHLKMHLRSRTYIKSPQTSDSKTIKVNPTSILESVPNISKPSKPVPGVLKANKPISTPETSKCLSITAKTQGVAVSQAKKHDKQSTPKPIRRTNSLTQNSIGVKKWRTEVKGNGNLKPHPIKKLTDKTYPELPVTRPEKVIVSVKKIPSNSEEKILLEDKIDNIEDKVKKIRENIAAKKIQRSWRNHQKRHSGKNEQQNVRKALTFIVTSLKHHKLRKGKINMLKKRKNLSPRIKTDDNAIVEAVQAAAKNIWEIEMNITSVN